MDNKELGAKGEKVVAKYLRKKRYKLLYRNFVSYSGEVDLIAENKHYIVFVEVKTRTEGQMLTPSLSVYYQKRRRIIKAASAYIKFSAITKQPRFDVAEVIARADGSFDVNYIENAFSQEEDYAVF